MEPKGTGWQYVYRYTDVWGNTRITYADDNDNGTIETGSSYSEIRREQNYYPFGLEHKGYNNMLSGVKNNLKTYQGQEFTEDLGLNTHEWRYRISDPAIGRFWQIDPLAEKYTYNSTYAFQENKLGMGIELEGAEVMGFDIAQNFIQRGINFFSGGNKMIQGGANMANEALSGGTAERMFAASKQNTDFDGPRIDENKQLVLDSARQVDESLPNKQDVRNLANGAEITGDILTVGGVATLQPEVVGAGKIIGVIGATTNLALDLSESEGTGDATRAVVKFGIKIGAGSLTKRLRGLSRTAAGKEAVEKGENVVSETIITVHQPVYKRLANKTVDEANDKE